MIVERDWKARCAAFSLAVAAGCLGAACGEEPAPEKEVARPVKILALGGGGASRLLEYPGEVEAWKDADVAFEVEGQIIELPVEEGDLVEEGALLARIDPRDYQARLDSEQAKVRASRAEYARMQKLFDAGVNSAQDLDRARRNFEVTTANVRIAEKAVADAELRAPFAGKVARKLVKDFRNVQAKEPVLVLQDDSSLKIVVSVPERDLALDAGNDQRLRDVAKVRVTVTSFPDQAFPAELVEAATTADPATRTYPVTLSFEVPDDLNVLPGMTAKATLELPAEVSGAGTAIPSSAVLMNEGSEPYVWRVDPASMTVSRATVVLGELSGDRVEIAGGLAPGDQIAVSGVHKLREGMTVRRFEE